MLERRQLQEILDGTVRRFMVSNQSTEIAFYLNEYFLGHFGEAFHGLLELQQDAVPELVKAYRASTETSLRAFLLKVIWQYRQTAELPLLTEALYEREPEIWKEAIDGLVSMATPESLQILQTARTRQFSDVRMGRMFSEWLEEANTQVVAQLSSIEREHPP